MDEKTMTATKECIINYIDELLNSPQYEHNCTANRVLHQVRFFVRVIDEEWIDKE